MSGDDENRDVDSRVRLSAFAFLDAKTKLHGGSLPWKVLSDGFDFDGRRVPLIGPQGIFKPAVLRDMPLSIATPPPVAGKAMKLALARRLRSFRTNRGLSQVAVAKVLGSSQSRVAKMEVGDATVSIDLLVRSLLTIGASRRDIARAIAQRAA